MRIVRNIIVLVSCLSVVGLSATPAAQAHEPQVIEPGSVELELGSLLGARLIHGTLRAPDDALNVAFSAPNATVQLLVPDREPERRAASVDLPRLRVNGRLLPLAEGPLVVDDVTGLRYRLVAATNAAGATQLRVERAQEPVRAALLVSAEEQETFRTNDPRRIPRTLAMLRQWYETPADGRAARPEGTTDAAPTQRARLVAWFGAGIALTGVLVAVWWVRRGRAQSRSRGTGPGGTQRP